MDKVGLPSPRGARAEGAGVWRQDGNAGIAGRGAKSVKVVREDRAILDMLERPRQTLQSSATTRARPARRTPGARPGRRAARSLSE